MLSDLYGKKIISTGGNILGEVKEVVINIDENEVSHLLLTKIEHLAKSEDVRSMLQKNSVMYKRVQKVSGTIIVSNK